MAINGLVNGTNVFGDCGKRFETEFEPGKRYRIRVVNAAMDTMFRFMMDGHNMTVIATDLVPIVPYTTGSVNVGIGQRYDVIVTADAPADAYWLRTVPSATCGSRHADPTNIRGIVRYRGAPSSSAESSPTTAMLPYEDSCADEPAASLVPVVPLDVGGASRQDAFAVGLQVVDGWFKWTLNNNTFVSDWSHPSEFFSLLVSCLCAADTKGGNPPILTTTATYVSPHQGLLQAISDNQNWQPNQQVVTLEGADQWVYFVIENTGFVSAFEELIRNRLPRSGRPNWAFC